MMNESTLIKIKELQTEGVFLDIVEFGMSVGIQNFILSVPGSSKIISSGRYINSESSQVKWFGNPDYNSVSRSYVKYILHNDTTRLDNKNVAVVSSSEWTSELCHGWIGVYHSCNFEYYVHYTFVADNKQPLDRQKCINRIAELAISVIHRAISCNWFSFEEQISKIPEFNGIDIVLDKDGYVDIPAAMHIGYGTGFKTPMVFRNGSMVQLETAYDTNNRLNVLKGTFYPINDKHVQMAGDKNKTLLCISPEIHDKGLISVTDLSNRIILCMIMGYNVCVHNSMYFFETEKMLKDRNYNDINWIISSDTAIHIITEAKKEYLAQTQFPKNNLITPNMNFILNACITLFEREGINCRNKITTKQGDLINQWITKKINNPISSTQIRNEISQDFYKNIENPILKQFLKEKVFKNWLKG